MTWQKLVALSAYFYLTLYKISIKIIGDDIKIAIKWTIVATFVSITKCNKQHGKYWLKLYYAWSWFYFFHKACIYLFFGETSVYTPFTRGFTLAQCILMYNLTIFGNIQYSKPNNNRYIVLLNELCQPHSYYATPCNIWQFTHH